MSGVGTVGWARPIHLKLPPTHGKFGLSGRPAAGPRRRQRRRRRNRRIALLDWAALCLVGRTAGDGDATRSRLPGRRDQPGGRQRHRAAQLRAGAGADRPARREN